MFEFFPEHNMLWFIGVCVCKVQPVYGDSVRFNGHYLLRIGQSLLK